VKLILIAVLVLVFAACVVLDRVYRAVDLKELKRRARGTTDTKSAKIYKAAAYAQSLETLLWLVGGAAVAGLVIMAAAYAWWLALLAVLAVLRLVWPVRPLRNNHSLSWDVAAFLAPPTAALVGLLHPLLNLVPGLPRSTGARKRHTGLYEKDDLLEFISRQNQQADNRVGEKDLQLAYGALTFGDKPVGKVMIPKSQAKFVAAGDTIGPHLMDELHASGQASFPVVKDAKVPDKDIVGTLHLSDVVEHPEGGRVRDIMKNDVYFINEQQTLHAALAAFLKTRTHLLVVINNFEEFVGTLAIEHVVEQILGQKLSEEFECYDDPRAVADIDAGKHHPEQSKAKVLK
jgi:CBS domain containing-hemolysin-like protein